jgi:hypothetical protein
MPRVRHIDPLPTLLLALLALAPAARSAAQEEDGSRAVRILEGPAPPDLELKRPLAQPVDLVGLQAKLKSVNPAQLGIDILPGPELAVGSKISVRVSAKRAGYLVLVDMDAGGKLTQIYPNPISLMRATIDRQNANFIKQGRTIQVPAAGDQLAGFEFVAEPPTGVAMIIALLSEHPVQMIDLPDLPPELVGKPEALTYLADWANDLRVPQPSGAGPLQDPKWSVAARAYAIR